MLKYKQTIQQTNRYNRNSIIQTIKRTELSLKHITIYFTNQIYKANDTDLPYCHVNLIMTERYLMYYILLSKKYGEIPSDINPRRSTELEEILKKGKHRSLAFRNALYIVE